MGMTNSHFLEGLRSLPGSLVTVVVSGVWMFVDPPTGGILVQLPKKSHT